MTGGNMYEWVGYTWNPLAGECPHQCEYCYVKTVANRYPQLRKKYSGPVRIDERALNQHLPKNRIIFVCSMNDLFAEDVPDEYIYAILNRAKEQEEGRRFLFQTKNPYRWWQYERLFPRNSIFITTLETNRDNVVKTEAPRPLERAAGFYSFRDGSIPIGLKTSYGITIEPILDFDMEIFVDWLEKMHPDFVNIGADSKGHHLPEPSEEKITALVRRLEEMHIKVHLKKNLRRLAPSLFSKEVMQNDR